MKICKGLEFLHADTYRKTNIMRLRDILLQLFVTNMLKKLFDLSWKYYQALFSVVEQLKSMPNLPNECCRENYRQLATLFNIKVKQRIGTDHFGCESFVNLFINEPIKSME